MPGDGASPGDLLTGWTRGTVPVRGGHLAYRRTGGGGPVLVLSHGLTDNGLCWLRLARELATDFDIVLLDARGHGGSSAPEAGQSFDGAEDIADAIDALGLERPIVMGHSLGGRATAVYAGRHPDRVARVILEDPGFLPVAEPAAAAARQARFQKEVARLRGMTEAELVAYGRRTNPDWHDDDLPDWAAAKLQVDAGALPTYTTPWQQEVAGLTAPTLVLHGEPEKGSLITPQVAEDIRTVIPQAEIRPIAGAAHNVRRENFTDVLAAVRGFLLTP